MITVYTVYDSISLCYDQVSAAGTKSDHKSMAAFCNSFQYYFHFSCLAGYTYFLL